LRLGPLLVESGLKEFRGRKQFGTAGDAPDINRQHRREQRIEVDIFLEIELLVVQIHAPGVVRVSHLSDGILPENRGAHASHESSRAFENGIPQIGLENGIIDQANKIQQPNGFLVHRVTLASFRIQRRKTRLVKPL
jgi:hypothetical protein